MMSKEFARQKIEEYLDKTGGILPIENAVVFSHCFDGIVIEEFTFKYLLCIAYDLKPEE